MWHAKCKVDRKSTRLNSSHSQISYAVFCLKKKTHQSSFFFFNDTATTEIYTLSLHDALPISDAKCADCLKLGADHAINYRTQDFAAEVQRITEGRGVDVILDMVAGGYVAREVQSRSEEHTSELQSQSNLVCRLLLEKKNSPVLFFFF